jgi:hypothetical protein
VKGTKRSAQKLDAEGDDKANLKKEISSLKLKVTKLEGAIGM